jgi:hypothetical protein
VKKKRFMEEQIAYALAQESTGQTIAEFCRKQPRVFGSLASLISQFGQGPQLLRSKPRSRPLTWLSPFRSPAHEEQVVGKRLFPRSR